MGFILEKREYAFQSLAICPERFVGHSYAFLLLRKANGTIQSSGTVAYTAGCLCPFDKI